MTSLSNRTLGPEPHAGCGRCETLASAQHDYRRERLGNVIGPRRTSSPVMTLPASCLEWSSEESNVVERYIAPA